MFKIALTAAEGLVLGLLCVWMRLLKLLRVCLHYLYHVYPLDVRQSNYNFGLYGKLTMYKMFLLKYLLMYKKSKLEERFYIVNMPQEVKLLINIQYMKRKNF